MQIAITITLLLNFIGVVQALMLAVVLFFRGTKNQLNFIIGLILIVLAVIMTNTLLSISGIIHENSFFQDVSNSVLFLIGPLIYLLVKYYNTGERWRAKHIYHFIPFIIYLPLSTSFGMFSMNTPDGLFFLPAINAIMIPWVWNVHMLIYLGFSYLFIKDQEKKHADDFNWIRGFVYGLAAIWFLNLLLTVISRTVFSIPHEIMHNVTLLFTIVIVSVVFKSFNDPILHANKSSIGLSEEEKLTWLKKMNVLFEEEKIYTDQDLRLSNISSKVGTNERIISLVIKDEYGQNFNEYLNNYRVNEVIRRLDTSDPLSYTIMALANESGFKSNSAFYKAFKQQTGLTPRAYMNQKQLSHQ